MEASKCFKCISMKQQQTISLYLFCAWANSIEPPVPPVQEDIIFKDLDGFFWKMIVSTDGNLGLETNPGPETPDLILDDGGGGKWKFFASTDGNIYTEQSLGVAIPAPTIDDGMGGMWQVGVSPDGNYWASL